jgi:hypothetical protein
LILETCVSRARDARWRVQFVESVRFAYTKHHLTECICNHSPSLGAIICYPKWTQKLNVKKRLCFVCTRRSFFVKCGLRELAISRPPVTPRPSRESANGAVAGYQPPGLGSARTPGLGSARPGSARPGPARLGPARLGSAPLGPARLGSAWLGAAWPSPAQPGPPQRFFFQVVREI